MNKEANYSFIYDDKGMVDKIIMNGKTYAPPNGWELRMKYYYKVIENMQ